MREAFGRLGGRTLIALDGTEYFASQKITCPHCQTRRRSNGKVESYHSMLAAAVVAPGHSKVVPLMPEFIVKPDGAEKQDCERNAVKRWLAKHGARLKPLCPVYLADDLFACQSVVERLAANGDDFIFTCKETSHKALYDFIAGAELERHLVGWQGQEQPDPPLPVHRQGSAARRQGRRAGQLDRLRNFRREGRRQIQDGLGHLADGHKSNVAEIVACGRARWKIENESFNVLKNHGYELEHNFGHGQNYLAMTLAALNMLAFAWHTILDLLEPPWQRARQAAETRNSFFAYLLTMTRLVIFPAWSELLEALASFSLPPHLLAMPKIE